MEAPLGVQVVRGTAQEGQQFRDLEAAELRHDGMERDSIGDDHGHLGNQAGDGGHHETGGSLAVNDGLDLVPAGLFHNFFDGTWMIEDRGFIEVPGIGLKVDTGAPVLQPHIIAAIDQVVDNGAFHRGAKQIGADAGSVNKQDGSFGGRIGAFDMDQVAGESISGFERDDLLAITFRHGAPRGKEMEQKCRARVEKNPRNSWQIWYLQASGLDRKAAGRGLYPQDSHYVVR